MGVCGWCISGSILIGAVALCFLLSPLRLQRDFLFDDAGDEFGGVFEVEFAEDVGAVGVDGSGAYGELGGDLFAGVSVHQELDDLFFLGGEEG